MNLHWKYSVILFYGKILSTKILIPLKWISTVQKQRKNVQVSVPRGWNGLLRQDKVSQCTMNMLSKCFSYFNIIYTVYKLKAKQNFFMFQAVLCFFYYLLFPLLCFIPMPVTGLSLYILRTNMLQNHVWILLSFPLILYT